MKKVPFDHDNLDIKNNLLNLARQSWDSGDFEKKLASLIIFASFAEYLAEHLLDTVRYAVERASYQSYGAVIFLKADDTKAKPLNMSDYINRLSNFEFPDKKDTLKLMKTIATARNKLFHDFARITLEEAAIVDKYVEDIKEGTEELITKVNTIEGSIKAQVVTLVTPPGTVDSSGAAAASQDESSNKEPESPKEL